MPHPHPLKKEEEEEEEGEGDDEEEEEEKKEKNVDWGGVTEEMGISGLENQDPACHAAWHSQKEKKIP